MAFYFRPHPTIQYRIPGTKRTIAATDITRRFSLANFVRNANVNFEEYYVQDGERPDTVAYDYYDDQTLDWLVLLSNEIHDPYYEWPLSYEQLNSYIIQKYGSTQAAYQTVHHYERILQEQQAITENGIQRIIPEKTLEVDYTTYLTLVASQRRIVSAYDYESQLNDQRRQIYLLDLNYVQVIKDQHPYIFEEGTFVR
jgi:hypothetical protein